MKLKTSVGVALVIFILVFGNIIAFGLLSSKNSAGKEPPLSYNSTNENSNSLNNKTKVSTTNNNPTSVSKPTPAPRPRPAPVTMAS